MANNTSGLSLVSSSQTHQLHKEVLAHTLEETRTPLLHFNRHDPDNVINWIARGTAGLFSSVAIVFFGLSLNEAGFPFGVQLLFASAAFLANSAQIFVSGRIAAKRHLDYLKNLSHALKDGRKGIENLLQVERIQDPKQKLLFAIKNATYFFGIELGLKWIIVYYVSMMPASLALQVPWLANDAFMEFSHAAIMMLLEPAIYERLRDLRLPVVTEAQVVETAIEEMRAAYDEILNQNEQSARFNVHHSNSTSNDLIHTIFEDEPDHLSSALLIHRKAISTSQIGSRMILTPALAAIYWLSNTGAYRATWENPDASLLSRIGSIFGDTCFGIFMSHRAAGFLSALWGHIRTTLRNEWRRTLLFTGSLATSGLTIASTLSANKEANMPPLVLGLGIGGTIYDNTVFLTEVSTELETQIALRLPNHEDPRFKQALISHFYTTLKNHYEDLQDPDFITYLKDQLEVRPKFLDNHLAYLHEKLPWAKGLSSKEIINTLTQSPEIAIKTIDRSGRFGAARHRIETAGALLSMLIASTTFTTLDPASTLWMLAEYVSPIAAIPMGLGTISLFSHCTRKKTAESLPLVGTSQDDVNELESAQNESPIACSFAESIVTATKFAICTGAPVVLKFVAQAFCSWILTNITDQSPEDSEEMSETFGNVAGTASAGLLTKYLGVSMR